MRNKILSQPTTNVAVSTQAMKDRKTIDQLKSYKKHWEPRWYLSRAFYEGVHFTYPKKDSTGNWQRRNEVGKNKVIREIPKAKKQLKLIRNLILKLKQRPVVYPDMNVIYSDQTDDKAKEQEKKMAFLQARYIENELNKKMKLSRYKKKLIKNAQLYGCAFIQILNENGNKEFAVYDPFDISVFPTISSINDYPVLAKHVSHRFEDLIGNELYDQDVIEKIKNTHKDGKYSSSIYKNSYMTERFGNAPDDNVIVDELYEIVKVKVDENGEYVENEEEYYANQVPQINEEDGQPMPVAELKEVERLRIRAYIGTEKVRDEVTKLSKIPISIFIWEDEAYETSLMEDMMPINKLYDILVSKLEHKAKKMDTGRYAIQKGEDTKVITTNDGEFIRYKRFKPELMAEAGVPNAFMEMINISENDLKEQGVALTSAAELPAGVEAWRAIESVKEIDYSSVGTQQDNLNECLTDIAEKLTEMIAYDMVDMKTVMIKGEDGKEQMYRVIGKRGADILTQGGNPLPENTLVIDPNRTTKVEIESEMTWTEEGKRSMIIDLIKIGVLPKEMGLEALKFGNVKDIIQKLITENTFGKSMIDTQDFKALPIEMQQQIIQFLAKGASAGGENPLAVEP